MNKKPLQLKITLEDRIDFFKIFDFTLEKFHTGNTLMALYLQMSLSSRGLGHRVFIPATGVRIPVGTPSISMPAKI